jgi:hypothetical protein
MLFSICDEAIAGGPIVGVGRGGELPKLHHIFSNEHIKLAVKEVIIGRVSVGEGPSMHRGADEKRALSGKVAEVTWPVERHSKLLVGIGIPHVRYAARH